MALLMPLRKSSRSRRPATGEALAGIVLAASLVAACGAQSRQNSLPNAPVPAVLAWNAPGSRLQTGNGPLAPSKAPPAEATDTVSLYTIVDLALRNSKAVQVAEAERQHAHGSMLEMRDAYIPNFSLGSGLGYSYGFPLGNPTLFNVNSTSLLFSFSQRDYIRSTQAAVKAATLSLKNVRQQVILDSSLNYIELDKTLAQIAALNEAIGATDQMVQVVGDRLQAGLESKASFTQAKLTRAKLRLREMQLEDHAEELRQHLANLTGLPPDAITPAPASIPELPDLDFHTLLQHSGHAPLVEAAFQTAKSKQFSAVGDKNQNYRPTVGMAFQYARFAPFNGYSLYYNHFTYNNIGFGIQAVWPLFDPIRRDKAMESKAEALRAQRQAELTRIQTDEGNYSMWHSLRELKAEQEVAQLQQEVAQDTLTSIQTQLNQGSPAAGAPPVTPQQADESRVEERSSYVDLRDAQFNVTRVELNLLNAIGGLEDWAKQGAQSPHSISPQVIQP
ncbi:MAG TPA: TolC family protein [Acidobacteriaceae bacterium]|nr:TolC family protein [Acidobacteriaceae bacterium]